MLKTHQLETIYYLDWERSPANTFWTEVAPCDHVCHIYDNEDDFIDLLEGFVSNGFKTGDCVVLVTTGSHLKALNARLAINGFDLDALTSTDQYITLNAEETLAKFMINDLPDEELFWNLVNELIDRTYKNGRQVRAFGEMVALLWEQNNAAATVQLEHLWNKVCDRESFCLFCAYPKVGFTQDTNASLMHICGSHNKMIANWNKYPTDIFYKNTNRKKAGN